jgi:hypothetical protein
MFPTWRVFVAAALAVLIQLGAIPAAAQEFRVYTAVHLCGPAPEQRQVVARSLTLFHAGRVYDHMEEVGELVMFDPLNDRFLLLRDSLATEVSFGELRTMLEVAAVSAGRYAAELDRRPEPEAARVAAQLRFQLAPRFETRFDPAQQRLTLVGRELSYHVEASTAAPPEALAAYVRYADWTARLNAVLRSEGTFPAPREALNRALTEHQLLPVSVTLKAGDPSESHLVAEHEFRWQLQAVDRDLIHQWERLRESDRLTWVSFREYQQKLLAAAKR